MMRRLAARIAAVALAGALSAGSGGSAFAQAASLVTPSAPLPMTGLASFLNAAFLSLGSCNSGTSAPTNGPGNAAFAGECWANTSSSVWVYSVTPDGINWVQFGSLDTVGRVWTPSLPSGAIGLQQANAVAFTGGSITGLPSPSNPSDAATKQYVDSTAQGLTIHSPVALATAAALPANTYNNGTAGVGATLTATANAALTVDGTAVTAGQRILVKNEATAANNGIYTVTATGSGSAPYVLTRATDANTPGVGNPSELGYGTYALATAGSLNINTGWIVNATVTTIGTSAVNFVQFSSAGSNTWAISGANIQSNNSGNVGIGMAPTQKLSLAGSFFLSNPSGFSVPSFSNGQGTLSSGPTYGAQLFGQGTTWDSALDNNSAQPVFGVVHGTTNLAGNGSITLTESAFSVPTLSNGQVVFGSGSGNGGQVAGKGSIYDSALDNNAANVALGVLTGTLNTRFVGDAYFGSGRPWVDVTSGANGCQAALNNDTGATQTTSAIQCQVNFMNTAPLYGGIVYFPPGTYEINSQITVNGGVMLLGAGQTATVIDASGADFRAIWFNSAAQGAGLQNMTVNGYANSAASNNLVRVGNGNVGLIFRDCQLYGGYFALDMNGVDNLIENCFISGWGSGGGGVISTGANWYLRDKIDTGGSPSQTPAYAFLQNASSFISGVVENHFILCDFSGPYTYSIYIADGTNEAITDVAGSVMSAPIAVTGAKATLFEHDEIGSGSFTINSGAGNASLMGNYAFTSTSIAGGGTNWKSCGNTNIASARC
jgi:Pectate lyase superfamily protein